MLCIPVWKNDRVSYLSLPLGCRMWQKQESKLELAASMIRQVMLEFQEKKQLKNSDKVKKYISVTRTEVKYRNENGSWVQDVREYPKTEAGIRNVIVSDHAMETVVRIRKTNPFGEYLYMEQALVNY